MVHVISLAAAVSSLALAVAPHQDVTPERHAHAAYGASAADTTVAVERGERVLLQNLSGRVSVEAWDRDEVYVAADAREGSGVRVRRADDQVRISPNQREGHGRGRYRVSVPAWVGLEIRGSELDVEVRGVNGGVAVRTAEGDVVVSDVRGPVSARSVEGEVRVSDVTGAVTARSGDDDVVVARVRGPVEARTVDGDVILDDVNGGRVDGGTVDGDVRFSGLLEADGEYTLSTHDGDLLVELDAGVDATVVVSMFDGDFESDFPVTMERFEAGKELRFTLGSGGPRVHLEAFDGSVTLRRR